jgi:hypothetical protein
MTEGAVAVYIALATALAVWGTIALYLGRVGARLRQIERDMERMPPPDGMPIAQPDATPPPAPAPPTATSARISSTYAPADYQLRLLAWLAALEGGCGATRWLLHQQSVQRWEEER